LVLTYQAPLNFTQNEVMTLASIVSHEASTAQDMKMVAGVLMNRLNIGMPLQSDVTLQYAKGYDRQLKTWWPEPKAADKAIVSPFNTYMNRGLPPHPICNPGSDSIIAVLQPAKNNFIYYLADSQGKVHYAATLEEHNKNVDKYLR
jgi:UPF0755 protein